MENVIGIRGISRDDSIALVALSHLPNRSGVAYSVFGLLADEKIDVDIILQSITERSKSDLSRNEIIFTINSKDVSRIDEVLKINMKTIGAEYVIDEKISKVSVSGVGMKGTPGVAAKVFRALYDAEIEIMHISTSEVKISLLMRKEYADAAVKALYEKFELTL